MITAMTTTANTAMDTPVARIRAGTDGVAPGNMGRNAMVRSAAAAGSMDTAVAMARTRAATAAGVARARRMLTWKIQTAFTP